MTDLHDQYLHGTITLLQALAPADDAYLTTLGLQGRLAQAIQDQRRYGPTSDSAAEIARVTSELDRLALDSLGTSFRALAGITFPSAPNTPGIYHNLPQPDYVHFIGRHNELARLRELLSGDSREWLITIVGPGGVGKSALALESAYHYVRSAATLPAAERFDAVVWISAKRVILSGEGPIPVSHPIATLDELFSAIGATLERQDITRARLAEQRQTVEKALTQLRVLLVVDNLDTVVDQAVVAFLRSLPVPTKALLTTRQLIDVPDAVRLTGMDWPDAHRLIQGECAKKYVSLSEAQARRLYARTGGVPLALVWSVAQLGFGHGWETVLARLGNPQGDFARYYFDSAMARVRGTDAHRLLKAHALFTVATPRETLGHVAGFGENTIGRDEALVDLLRLSLVSVRDGRTEMLPLTRTYAQHELELDPGFAAQAVQRWRTHLTALLATTTPRYWIEDQGKIIAEGENFLALLEWALAHDDLATAVAVIQPTSLYLAYTARRAEALKLSEAGIEVARQQQDAGVGAWLCAQSGWILSQQGLHDAAVERLQAAVAQYEALPDPAGACFAQCLLAQAVRQGGNWAAADRLLDSAAARAARLDFAEGRALAEFERGKVARERTDWPQAFVHLQAAHAAASALVDRQDQFFSLTILAIQGNLGMAALQLDQLALAQRLTQQVLAVLGDERWSQLGVARSFHARMHLQAATIEVRLAHAPLARRHAEQAIDFYRCTNETKAMRQAETLLRELTSHEPA